MAADTTTAAELTQEQVQAILVQPLETASVFLAAVRGSSIPTAARSGCRSSLRWMRRRGTARTS